MKRLLLARINTLSLKENNRYYSVSIISDCNSTQTSSIKMIQLHEEIDEDETGDPVEDLLISSQKLPSSLADTVILSSNHQSDDTILSDLSQNSSNFDDNILSIEYSPIEEKSTNSECYLSAFSLEDTGLNLLINIHEDSGGQFSETSNNTILLQPENSGLEAELPHSVPWRNSLNDYSECFMKNDSGRAILEKNGLVREQEKFMKNIETYEVEKRELNLAKQKLAEEQKILTEGRILFNSNSTLLTKEMKKIRTNIKLIQKRHNDLLEFCSKSEEMLRLNKIKLKEIKAQLDIVRRENYANNLTYESLN